MKRMLMVSTCLVLVLSACDNRKEQGDATVASSDAAAPRMQVAGGAPAFAAAPVAAPPDAAAEPKQGQDLPTGEAYVYDHALSLSMASEFIKARFERARGHCQDDVALKCRVTAASFQLLGGPDAPLPTATLQVALPHNEIEPFISTLMESLPGEDRGDVVIRSRNTSAENVTNQVRDIQGKLGQLKDYRKRMEDLADRRNASTEDLIKIQGEISHTQAEIDQIESQKRDLADRIARENLSITFEAQSTASDAFQPVRDVWQGALRTLAESTASAVGLVIGLVPWIPVLFGALFAVRYLWRRVRKA
jgi:hypothetical protein